MTRNKTRIKAEVFLAAYIEAVGKNMDRETFADSIGLKLQSVDSRVCVLRAAGHKIPTLRKIRKRKTPSPAVSKALEQLSQMDGARAQKQRIEAAAEEVIDRLTLVPDDDMDEIDRLLAE